VTHTFVGSIRSWGPIALTLHGRTRQQRYSRLADWNYIQQCAEVSQPAGVSHAHVSNHQLWSLCLDCLPGYIAA
jgi:tRNA-dihydrouridine synthase 3